MDANTNVGELAAILRAQVASIEALIVVDNLEGQGRLFRKTLFVALLDCISEIRFNSKWCREPPKGNKQRFVELVRQHGGWAEGDLVSGPVLANRLKVAGKEGQLLQLVEERLAAFNPLCDDGGVHPLGRWDFSKESLIKVSSSREEEKAISQSTHLEMLYTYRNTLIHEFRERDGGWDVMAERSGERGCYIAFHGEARLRPVYQLELFQGLASKVIDGLEAFLFDKGIDPFDRACVPDAW